MFSIAPDAPAPARDRLWRAMRDCDRFIPGITRCAVGTNTADGPVELVWETTYESVGAYATTYMTHPYHAALLDRFLLPDCPERITTTNDLGAGLIGYTVDRDRPLGPVAIRRLLLLDFADPDCRRRRRPVRSPPPTTAGASRSWPRTPWRPAGSTARPTSVAARRGPHLWDQCFATVDQYDAHRERNGAAAPIEADIIGRARRTAEVVYVPEER